MPAKGFQVSRENIISPLFAKKFTEETGIQVDYKTLRQIIIASNTKIADIITKGEDGFRIPKGMGIFVVGKYKPQKKGIDWLNTIKYGKRIYHNNLNTFSNMFKIKWYRIDVTQLFLSRVYKFRACRDLKRSVAAFAKQTNGSHYFEWAYKDFYEATRLERYMMKRNKNKE